MWKLLFNDGRKLFMSQLGSNLLLIQLGINPAGFVGVVLGFLLVGVIGYIVESGIFIIDISLDALREGMKLKEFSKAATLAYDRATAKVYTEKEKEAIRREYLKIISNIGPVGNPK